MNVVQNNRSKCTDARFDDFTKVIAFGNRQNQNASNSTWSDSPRSLAFTTKFPTPGTVLGTPAVRRSTTGSSESSFSRPPPPKPPPPRPPLPSFFDPPRCSNLLPALFGPPSKANAPQDVFKTPSLVDFRTSTDKSRRFSSSSSPKGNSSSFSGSSSSSRLLSTPSSAQINFPRLHKLRKDPLSLTTPASASAKSFTTPSSTPRNYRKSSTTPRTPGTTSSSNVDPSSPCVILAITEGRGHRRYEVGMAAIDINRPSLILTQISDTPTYSGTLAKIAMFDPVEIVVPHTIAEGHQSQQLFQVLRKDIGRVSLSSAHRKFFNDTQGLQKISSLCLPEYEACQVLFKDKYFALAASNALIRYVEVVRLVMFSGKSLKVEYQGAEHGTFIGRKTAEDLELLNNRDDGSKKNSLLSVLDKCLTLSGTRLLRTTILQPPCNQELISGRLDCVEELVRDHNRLENMRGVLRTLPDVSQLLTLCMQAPANADHKAASENRFNRVLTLKTTLQTIPAIAATFQNVRSPWFLIAKKVLNDNRIKEMLQQISEVLNEDARIVKGKKNLTLQRSFGVKTGINERLDVTRQYYTQLIVDMTEYVQELGMKYDLPLKLQCNATRGYHIQVQIPKKFKYASFQMPAECLQVHRSRTLISCTTEFICLHNDRIKNLAYDLVDLSDKILKPLVEDLRKHMGCLYRLSEVIAELDIIVALATVSRTQGFTRPAFDNHLAVVDSKHAILDIMLSTELIPNDVFASEESNFTILTGPNMSGKSIYLRQVLILQIMAQVGCFVPAKKATFRIADRIYSRLRFEDEIDKEAGALVSELREVSLMFKTFSPRSVVVLDEACQGTSVEEGVPLAWALCEAFLQTKAFVFFATHLHALTKLSNVYPRRVTNLTFEVVETPLMEGGVQLEYTHRLIPGPTTVQNYGLRLAETADLPASVLEEAREISAADTTTFEAPLASKYMQLTKEKVAAKGKGVLERLYYTDQLRLETATNLKQCILESLASSDSENDSQSEAQNSGDTIDKRPADAAAALLSLLNDYSSSVDQESDRNDDPMEMDDNFSDDQSEFSFQSAPTVLLDRNTPSIYSDLEEMDEDDEGFDHKVYDDEEDDDESDIFEQAIKRHEAMYGLGSWIRSPSPPNFDSSPVVEVTPRPPWGLLQSRSATQTSQRWMPLQNTDSSGFYSGPGSHLTPTYEERQRQTETPSFQRMLRNLYKSPNEESYHHEDEVDLTSELD